MTQTGSRLFSASEKPVLNTGFEYHGPVGRDAASGEMVLDYLARRYRHSTREQWRCRIESGFVLLQGKVATPDLPVRAGQMLVWRRPPWQEPEAPLCFAILYRDDHLLAVAKPAGLPTLAGGGFLVRTLLSLVNRRYPEAKPLHRLGRGTSGLVLFGRTALARSRITAAWRAGEVVKIYRALARGAPDCNEFSVDARIGPVPYPVLGTVHAATPGGVRSHSTVRVLERRRGVSLVEVTIATGRPHQIRIHLAAAGYPLAGDPLYTAGGVPAEGSRALPGETGYLLHAQRLGLQHPVTGRALELICLSPPPLRIRGN